MFLYSILLLVVTWSSTIKVVVLAEEFVVAGYLPGRSPILLNGSLDHTPLLVLIIVVSICVFQNIDPTLMSTIQLLI